jgi:hypothetical protein
LHAATIARYAYFQNNSVGDLYFEDFEGWATESDAGFIIDMKREFRWLQQQITNDKFNADRAAKLSTLLEKQDGDDDKYMKALLHFLGGWRGERVVPSYRGVNGIVIDIISFVEPPDIHY